MDTARVRPGDKIAANGTVALDSAALRRLMDEVRNNAVSAPAAYNRMHNRHNR